MARHCRPTLWADNVGHHFDVILSADTVGWQCWSFWRYFVGRHCGLTMSVILTLFCRPTLWADNVGHHLDVILSADTVGCVEEVPTCDWHRQPTPDNSMARLISWQALPYYWLVLAVSPPCWRLSSVTKMRTGTVGRQWQAVWLGLRTASNLFKSFHSKHCFHLSSSR